MTHTPNSPARGRAAVKSAPQSLLGRASLLASESAEAYDDLTAQCAAAVDPQDMVEWLMVRDYVDLSWEILRLRRMKQHIITVASPDAVSYIAGELADTRERSEASAAAVQAWIKGGAAQQALRRDLARRDVSQDTIETHAFLRELNSIGSIERILAEKERMRRAVLRDLEIYRAGSLWKGRPIVGKEIETAVDRVEAPSGPRLAAGEG